MKWLRNLLRGLPAGAASAPPDFNGDGPNCFRDPRPAPLERLRQLLTALLYLLPLASFALSLLTIFLLLVSLVVSLFTG